jgi:hypothetical protein
MSLFPGNSSLTRKREEDEEEQSCDSSKLHKSDFTAYCNHNIITLILQITIITIVIIEQIIIFFHTKVLIILILSQRKSIITLVCTGILIKKEMIDKKI